jgi:hypothetical protein
LTGSDRFVASETFSHVDKASLALPVSVLELLALRWERIDERWFKTVDGFVSVDHNAVTVGEARRERCACWVSVNIRAALLWTAYEYLCRKSA